MTLGRRLLKKNTVDKFRHVPTCSSKKTTHRATTCVVESVKQFLLQGYPKTYKQTKILTQAHRHTLLSLLQKISLRLSNLIMLPGDKLSPFKRIIVRTIATGEREEKENGYL